MAEARAEVSRRRGVSRIWIVPIVAVLLGAWMVAYTWATEGPTIEITFSTAEGIESGKTKVKARSVEVGVVESVELAKDLESVVVTAKMEHSAARLLREDSQLWVVRPRIGAAGVSGVGTILSGGYIELEPGEGEAGRREFRGLEDPPVTPVGTPGLRLSLISERAGSISAGDDITYRGIRVGRIESVVLDTDAQEVRYEAFVEAPYEDLVRRNTRFWNTSGIHFSAGVDGVQLQTGSLKSLLLGGVAFGLPEGMEPGRRVRNGAVFQLFPDQGSIDTPFYEYGLLYVVEFERSVRGLRPGAPVEYRGLHAGQVERIMLREMSRRMDLAPGHGAPIAVLIRLQPGSLEMGDSEDGKKLLRETVENAVKNGLRATLSTGNLLTGSLYVALDIHPDEAPASMGRFAGHPTIPTIAGGLEGIELRVTRLLDKLNALPLEDVARTADGTLGSAEATLDEVRRAVVDLRAMLESEGVRNLPASLDASLEELNRTLRGVSALAQTLDEQPNALIFPRDATPDPEPPAGAPAP